MFLSFYCRATDGTSETVCSPDKFITTMTVQVHYGHDIVHRMHLYAKKQERTQNLRSDFSTTSK